MTFSKRNLRGAKRSIGEILQIRQQYKDGWSQGRLAREWKMSVGQIGRIVRGESWAELEESGGMLPPDQVDMEAAAKRLAKMMEEATEKRRQDNLVDDLLKDDKGDSKDG